MPLSKSEVSEFEKALLKEKADLLRPVNTAELVTEKLSDEADIASMDMDHVVYQRLTARNLLYVKKIDEALDKMKRGVYGECEGCGDDIGVKRLKARMTAALCIDCKAEQEKHEKLLKQSGGASQWDANDKTG